MDTPVHSWSFPLSREPYNSPILIPPHTLSMASVLCPQHKSAAVHTSKVQMWCLRVWWQCACVSVGDSPLGLLCCWWWLTGIYGYVWMHRSEHRATASATASALPPWHHHGDVLLVRGTASIWCSKPMRERKKEIVGGPSTLLLSCRVGGTITGPLHAAQVCEK